VPRLDRALGKLGARGPLARAFRKLGRHRPAGIGSAHPTIMAGGMPNGRKAREKTFSNIY
jgi:hypothetical protein